MKTRLYLNIALAISGTLCGRAESAESAAPTHSRDFYSIDVKVAPSRGSYEGKMTLYYRNLGSSTMSVVRLRLDGNLGTQQTIEISSVEDDSGKALSWAFRTVKYGRFVSEKGALEVTLPAPLASGSDVALEIGFHGEGHFVGADMVIFQDAPFHSLDAWYPKAMSPRGEGWSLDDDRPADYDVSLRLPEKWAVGSTGRVNEEVLRDGERRLQLKAEAVRGFTIYASPDWQRHEKHYGDFELGICLPEEADSWTDRFMDVAADAIAFYEAEYGHFPTKHLDIVCPGRLGGKADGSSAACNVIMVFLSGQLEKQYRFLISHEVAHQYFGSQVGFSRDSIGWVPIGLGLMMDEHYQTARGLDAPFGRMMMRDFYLRAERMGFDTTLSQPVQGAMRAPPPWSQGWNMSLAHGKAYAVCAMLRDLMGEDEFRTVIRNIIATHAGGLVADGDFIHQCECALGEHLDWFVADWIDGRTTLDYEIADVRKTDVGWDIEVKRVGSGRFPVLLQVTTEDGKTLSQRADRDAMTSTLHFKTSSDLKSAAIDPKGYYPDVNPSNNIWPRTGGGK